MTTYITFSQFNCFVKTKKPQGKQKDNPQTKIKTNYAMLIKNVEHFQNKSPDQFKNGIRYKYKSSFLDIGSL